MSTERTEIQKLIEDAGALISLPEVSIQVNKMVDDPSVTAADIGKVLSRDPALVAQLLKLANSPLYGFSREVDTVSRAVALLGTNRLRDLVLSSSVSHAFDGIPNDLISMEDFWHHSLYCGVLAQFLARHSGKTGDESLFVAGLLHDIGQLVMFNRMPEQSHQAILLVMEDPEEPEMFEAERRIFGFDHMQVGEALVTKWQLSPKLRECVAHHHEPSKAKDFPLETALVHVANAVAVMVELESTDELPHIDPVCWELTGLDAGDLPSVIEEARGELAEVEAALFGSA